MAGTAKHDPAQEKAGLKIHISRGLGGRGYSPTQVSESSVTISAFAFPATIKYGVIRD